MWLIQHHNTVQGESGCNGEHGNWDILLGSVVAIQCGDDDFLNSINVSMLSRFESEKGNEDMGRLSCSPQTKLMGCPPSEQDIKSVPWKASCAAFLNHSGDVFAKTNPYVSCIHRFGVALDLTLFPVFPKDYDLPRTTDFRKQNDYLP
jgi:hypothetical protein